MATKRKKKDQVRKKKGVHDHMKKKKVEEHNIMGKQAGVSTHSTIC